MLCRWVTKHIGEQEVMSLFSPRMLLAGLSVSSCRRSGQMQIVRQPSVTSDAIPQVMLLWHPYWQSLRGDEDEG